MKKLDWYILRTVVGPGVYGLLIFSTLWLVQILMKMIDLLVTKDVPFLTVSKIFAYSIPQVFVTSAPMASLLAVLVGISRMNSESEIVAIKASGISFYRMMVPLIGLGIVVSLAVLSVGEFVVPRASKLRTKIYLNDVMLKKPLPKVAQNLFFEGGTSFKVFVRRYDHRRSRIENVTVFQFENSAYPRITEAKAAILSEKRWVFQEGSTLETGIDGRIQHIIHFGAWDYPLDLRYGEEVDNPKPRPAEMSIPELWAEIQESSARGIEVLEHRIEFWWKIAFPFASLVMVLLGAPLAVSSGRSGASLGVGLSILIMFFYYVLLAIGKTCGESGYLSPFWAAWLPNAVMIGFTGILFRRASR